MRALALSPEEVTPEGITGRVLCQDIVTVGDTGRVKLGKGHILERGDAHALQSFSGEIHLIEMEPGDVHEDDAGARLARAVAGPGVELKGPVESQVHFRATHRGLLQVRIETLHRINCLPDVSIFTAYDGQPVREGRAVGAAKVTPLVVSGDVVEEAETIAAECGPVVQVWPFLGRQVGVVVRERLTDRSRDRFESAINMKIGWFGSPLAGIKYMPDDVGAIADAIQDYLSSGVSLILAAGVNSTDPLDLTIQALDRVGAVTEHRGVPAHPGSTCWLAYAGEVPVFGLALCGMFSKNTVLDLLLPRFLSGRPVRATDIASLGHGGLLNKDMAFRFPDYED